MRKVILLALLMPYMAFGQIMENFESGSINSWLQSTYGRWKADTIGSLSGRYSLHHVFDNPASGVDQTGFQVKNLHPERDLTKWTFLVKYGYDPSASNNWSVFLMSDAEPSTMSPNGGANGFAIGVNLTGSDDTLRLWKIKGSTVKSVISCPINWQTGIGKTDPVKIIVERSIEGIWWVSVFRLNGNIVGTASGTDSELFSSSWVGIYYKYTSTCDRLLWLDDIKIEGNFYEDKEAPVIAGCEVTGKKSVKISINEEPADDLFIAENISLNTLENKPVTVSKLKALTYIIEFANGFINRSLNVITVSKLCDKLGNCAQNVQVSFTPIWAETGDVIISEIMADPLPVVSLPAKEYLELTNRTEYSFNLKNWKLSSESQTLLFSEATIHPLEIVIICLLQDTSLFTKYGKVIGMKQFPSLTDGGKILCLSDSSGNMVNGVEYSTDWYKDELKSAGGWSLEMIDTQFPFYGEENWIASSSRRGGTPGSANSVSSSNTDISFYGVQNVFPDDSIKIRIRFSEPVFNISEIIKSTKIGESNIIDLIPIDPLFREFSFTIEDPLLRGEVYQLDISGDIKDFAGNGMQKGNFKFGLTELAEHRDILFNELLFNSLPDDPDYIELYNNSPKVIDASRLQIISVNDGTGDTSQIYPLSDEKRCIMSGSYYAITIDKGKISDRYFSSDPENIFENGSLPSMADDEGHLILLNRELDLIDEVLYNEKMHYSLLSGYEGVALEKTLPGYPSKEAGNWHSATEISGWGTPGAPNSVFVEMAAAADKVILSSSKITPDNDGYEDFLTIGFRLTGNGNVVSVMIFDETGNYVKKIAANMLAGPEATLIWDGTADDSSPVNTGIYIVFITLFDDTGKTEKWKKVCTVLR